jgi:hypothetical protein
MNQFNWHFLIFAERDYLPDGFSDEIAPGKQKTVFVAIHDTLGRSILGKF